MRFCPSDLDSFPKRKAEEAAAVAKMMDSSQMPGGLKDGADGDGQADNDKPGLVRRDSVIEGEHAKLRIAMPMVFRDPIQGQEPPAHGQGLRSL